MNNVPDITVTEINEIITIHSKKGRKIKMENRGSYGLSFCNQGQITYTHNGQKFISDKDCAIFLPKGATYTLYGDETGDFSLINFQCKNLDLSTFKTIPVLSSEGYVKDIEKMKKLSLFGNSLKIKSIFYDILNQLFSENFINQSIISPALKIIETDYSNQTLNNKLLAQKCNISEVYFRRIFAEKTGTTPKQYILDIRIKRAKQLLENPEFSVTAIAEKCGFGSVYHFCRAFKQVTGLTPTQFGNLAKKTGL